MDPRRLEAHKMRLEGFSYGEISQELGIAKSTLSGWFKDLVLNDRAKERLESRKSVGTEHLIRLNKQQTHKAQRRARENFLQGKNAIGEMSKEGLLLIGIALYWGEGYKRLHVREGRELMSHTISFSNSDPDMIRVFILFLEQELDVCMTDIRATMHLYPHINEEGALHFWMGVTRLSKERFFKSTYSVSSASKRILPYNRLPWGTLKIEACNTAKFHYLLGLIQGVKDRFNYDIMPSPPG
ncbi:MAG: hypothetical protein P4M11_05025 [Candidatus Pacebacteria bacterium]|nr:hypothetical protein [Candidatus Paceibacterota bacterium]